MKQELLWIPQTLKRKIREYYKQYYIYKSNNLNEISQFIKRQQKINQRRI